MVDAWTGITPALERKMDADVPGSSEGRTYQVNVAPIISDEKVSFVVRQMASTLSGGLRILPGMTRKAHLLQFTVWLGPSVFGLVVAIALGSQSALLRFLVAGTIAALCVVAVDGLRWHVCRRGQDESGRQNMWFTDYDEVDYASLLSPATFRAMFPPKRSSPHIFLSWIFSFLLMGTAAGVLNFQSIEADLGEGFGNWLAVSLSMKCFLTVTTAQFGLTTCPPNESTSHRYCDPLTVPGLLEDYSRPLLVLALLVPAFFELGAAGAWLRVTAALLPVLWATGVMPQLDTLLSWGMDQLEVNLFGGSPVPRDVRLVGAILASVTASATIALISKATAEQSEELAAILVLITGTLLAGLLALLPPRLVDFGSPLLNRLGAAELQVVVSAVLTIVLLLGLGIDDVRASLAGDREMSAAWVIRLLLEQVAALLSFGGLYFTSRRQRAGGCWGVIRQRSGTHKSSSTAGKLGGQLASATTRRLYAILEVLVRVALLTHAACYGVVAVVAPDEGFPAFDAAALMRAWRIVLADPLRAAGDAWIVGILDCVLAGAGLDEGPISWSLGARLLFVSVVRQRLIALLQRMQYATHLSRVTSAIPKLRHPVTGKVLLANVVLFPFLLLVLVLSAMLESPLVALFTLPCFLVGYPRPRHGHPELSPDSTPLSKGVEGLFYSILAPSLLKDLVPRWRFGALSTQPGMLLFCRSHERLACLVRVLGAGFGWVQVEVRGLEMQEPTSCHHVEAGIIDDAFSFAFKGEALPPPRRQGPGQGGSGSAGAQGGGAEPANGSSPGLFVLQPVCQVRATTYEQTQLSMTGIIDSHDTLRQVHRLFLKTLLWVMAQHRCNGGPIPRAWLSCPVKARDAQTVLSLLRSSKWPQHVGTVFNTQDLLASAGIANVGSTTGANSALAKDGTTARESSTDNGLPSRANSGQLSPLRPETPSNGAWAELDRPASPWQDTSANLYSCPMPGQLASPPAKEVAKAPEPVARVPSPPLAPAPAPVAAVAACRGSSNLHRSGSRTDSDPLRCKSEGFVAGDQNKDMDLAPLTGRLPELLRSRSGCSVGGGDGLAPKAPAGMGMPEVDGWPVLDQAGQPPLARRSNPLAHPLAPLDRAPSSNLPDVGWMPDHRNLSGGLGGGLGQGPQPPPCLNHRPQTPPGMQRQPSGGMTFGGARQGFAPTTGSNTNRERASFGSPGMRLNLDEMAPPHLQSPTSRELPPCKPPVRSGCSPRMHSGVENASPRGGAPQPPPDRPQPQPPQTPPEERSRAQEKSEQEDDLDKLMDMVLDITPGKKKEEDRSPKRSSRTSPYKKHRHRDRDRSCSPVRSDDGLRHWDQEVADSILNPMPKKHRELMHQASPSPELEDVIQQDGPAMFVPQPPLRSPPPLSPGPDTQLFRREQRSPSGAGLARSPTPPGISAPTDRSGSLRADVAPSGPAVARKTPSPPAEPFRPPAPMQLACLDDLDPVTALALQTYVAINIAPTYNSSPEALGPMHVFKAFTGKFAQGSQSEVSWLLELPEVQELAVRAFRYALKITVDCIAMAEDAAAMDDEELETELRELDAQWHLGDECEQAWQVAMEERRPHLMALRRLQGSSSGYQVLRLNLREDDVNVAELRPEVVQSIWASQSLELRYFTNDDDERYSIQAHPTLLRNMIVQSAEYPIFVSPPTTVWL